MYSAMRRHASKWAVNLAPKEPYHEAESPRGSEGSSEISNMGERSSNGRGATPRHVCKDGPETWETSYLHLEGKRQQDGRPQQGTTGAAADGEEESEDRIGATTSGNRRAPGPG